jgi:hypothetical protein
MRKKLPWVAKVNEQSNAEAPRKLKRVPTVNRDDVMVVRQANELFFFFNPFLQSENPGTLVIFQFRYIV